MTAALYLRKSRAEESEPVSETLARHRDILRKYADDNGVTIVDVYEEVASGDSLYGRPEMLRLLSVLDRYEAILCMDIDRLGRGTMHEQGLILDAVRNAGMLIVTPGKTYDLDNDMDDSLISFKALFAREEYKMIKGRLRRGTVKAVQEGYYLSNAPYGYNKAAINKKPTLSINDEEAQAVRLIFQRYIEGNGCTVIADELHTLGYKPHRSDKFNRTSIAKILRNPTYTGKVIWNQSEHKRPKIAGEKHSKRTKPESEWMVVDGRHPPIIDEVIYNKAMELMKNRSHPPYRTKEIKNPMAGVLHCAQCGASMIRQPLQNRKYQQPIIMCPTPGCCMSSALVITEQRFFAMMQFWSEQLEAEERDNVPDSIVADDTGRRMRSEITKIDQQLSKLHDLLERGIYDSDTFVARRLELMERRDALHAAVPTRREQTRRQIIERLRTVLDNYWGAEPGDRNRLIKSVVERAHYTKPKGSGWSSIPELRIVEWAKLL